jgi:RHS repeat-associated protein
LPARYITYDAFGNIAAETDVAIAHLFGYTGREFDKGTGLQYNRERYYDPKLGRFISQDPMSFAAGDANLYRMTGNHPNMSRDPSGLFDDGLMPIKILTASEAQAARQDELEAMRTELEAQSVEFEEHLRRERLTFSYGAFGALDVSETVKSEPSKRLDRQEV